MLFRERGGERLRGDGDGGRRMRLGMVALLRIRVVVFVVEGGSLYGSLGKRIGRRALGERGLRGSISGSLKEEEGGKMFSLREQVSLFTL